MVENELDSTCGISDDDFSRRFAEAVRIENEIKRVKGTPIPFYDIETKTSCLIYPDGKRKYVSSN